MTEMLGNIFKVIVTTFVIIYPVLMLKNHPFYAEIIGIVLAIVINSVLNPEWKT